MVFRFLILSDEVDDFKREIKIDAKQLSLICTTPSLSRLATRKIRCALSLFVTTIGAKNTEITLVEMDTTSEVDNYIMAETRLEELLEDEHQKLMFVFDYMTERAFFMELREIEPGKDLDKAIVSKSIGVAPAQTIDFDEFETKTGSTEIGEDFYGDSEYDIDELDKGGFEGLGDVPMENPYDDERF